MQLVACHWNHLHQRMDCMEDVYTAMTVQWATHQQQDLQQHLNDMEEM